MCFPYVRQLLGVAKGLEYLHSLDIPHGDLKGVCHHRKISARILTAVIAALKPLSFMLQLCDYTATNSIVTGKCRH